MVAGRQRRTVRHEQDVGRRRALVRAEPRPVAEVGRQQRGEVLERGRDHPLRADRVGLLAAQGVGQPLQPVPVDQVALGGEHRDHEVLGGVEGGRGADHGAGQGPGRLVLAADLDPVERAQVDAGRQVGLQPVHDEQPVERRGGGGVDLVDRGALRRHELRRQRLRARPVPHVQEVVVPAGVLPDPGPILGEGRQRGRLGVVPGERATLLLGGVAGDRADVGEVAQVLRARSGDLLGALLPLPVELHDDEAERGEEEHARRDVAAAGVGALLAGHRGDEHDRAEAAEHRDGVHQDAAGALVLLDLRRWLEHDLAGRQLRLVEPRPPQRGAHVTSSTATTRAPTAPASGAASRCHRAGRRSRRSTRRRAPARTPRRC